MPVLGRAHTIAATTCMALIPLVPLGLWGYAKAASVDRASTVARNQRVFRSVRHLEGARSLGGSSYPAYRWGVEGAMVPVSGYWTEYLLTLPHAVPITSIYAHYEHVFTGWNEQRDSESVQFRRAGVEVDVTTAETADGSRARQYGFYVSQ